MYIPFLKANETYSLCNFVLCVSDNEGFPGKFCDLGITLTWEVTAYFSRIVHGCTPNIQAYFLPILS